VVYPEKIVIGFGFDLYCIHHDSC